MNDIVDRGNPLEAFAKSEDEEGHSLPVPAHVFAAPAERVYGAQPVAVRRDEEHILKVIKKLAAAAGDDWYYRFPVKKKVKNEETGKEEYVTDHIEGPSIKCANNVARLFGNCDIDVRVQDIGDSYLFYARFMDLETGYGMTRPFRQRKSQKTMRTEGGRQEDIVFQIGASKAIRNVVCNSLEFFTTFAMEEAKTSIIERIGKDLPRYRTRIGERLSDLRVELKRVELLRGRPMKDWLVPDVARTIAEIQAINDGMATADETWPSAETGEIQKASEQPQGQETKLNEFAGDKGKPAETGGGQPSTASATGDGGQNAASGPKDSPSSSAGSEAAKPAQEQKKEPDKPKQDAAAETKTATPAEPPKLPTNEAEYIAYSDVWIEALTDPEEGLQQWSKEKSMRNKCQVTAERREAQNVKLNNKVRQLTT